MRRQPVRIVDGRAEGGYTGVFEFICPGCGDNPYVDYSEIPPQLQWLRGPRRLEAVLEAYDKHLEPLPGPNGDSAGRLGPGYAEASRSVSARRRSVRLGPALEGTSDERWRRDVTREPARSRDRVAVALDDGQALVLD